MIIETLPPDFYAIGANMTGSEQRKGACMKKFLMGLLVTVVILSIGGVLLSGLYTRTVSENLTRLRLESRSDIVYLRTRVRELESELTAFLMNSLNPPTESVGSNNVSATDTETEEDATEAQPESVTLPSHRAPETQPPIDTAPDSEIRNAEYILSEYQGVIGVFDHGGTLLKTVNVFVMTLPDAERTRLEVGIPAYSYAELCSLIEQYE